MNDFFLAPALVTLRDEVNRRWPARDKASDGWIGDASHQARVSSHNPLWSAPGRWSGVVRAVDLDNDGAPDARTELVRAVLDAAIGDPRVWYVIYSRTIYSRTFGWRAQRYTGVNPHDHHVHVSLRETQDAWGDTRAWLEPDRPAKTTPPAVSLPHVRREFLIAVGSESGTPAQRPGVRRIQSALNVDYSAGLTVDGVVGDRTVEAWRFHEARVGISGRPRVPDERTLAALARGRFRVLT